MSVRYPNPKQYKHQQSQIRYNFKISNTIKQKALKYVFAFKQLNKYHYVKSDLLIDSLEYFVNIIKKWDDKSKQINGWTSCFLTIQIIREILNSLKKKFHYFSRDFRFSNIEALYQLTGCTNKKIIPLNNLLFGLLVAIEEHPSSIQFSNLQIIIEFMAKRQLLYLIPNYRSRGTRTYELPWERIDDPIVDYRKKYLKRRINNIKTRKLLQPNRNQLKINQFFNSASLNKEDDETLELLCSLDNKDEQEEYHNI